jgi:hypothetical protein
VRVRTRLAAAVLASLLSSSCLVVSLQPVYEPETIAFDPALLGSWASADDDLTVTFERGEWHSYHLTLEQRDDRYRLSARMTRIGAGLYLDVTPLDGTDMPALTLPVHGCLRVELIDESLSLAELDYEWFERQRGEAKPALPFVVDARRNVVITAGTTELRQWIAQHSPAEGVFAAPTTFTRR